MATRVAAVALAIAEMACGFDAAGHIAADAMEPGGSIDARPTIDASTFVADAQPSNGIEFRVNVSGVAHSGIDFPGQWTADSGECNGFDNTPVVGDVLGTQDDPLFRNYRYSDLSTAMRCNIGTALPSGDYEVLLLFGEVYHGDGCPGGGGTGSRTFDISIEGQLFESGLDPFAEGGCCYPTSTAPGQPIVRTFTQQVTDGTVTIDFAPVANTYSMVSAIQIRGLQ